VDGKEDNRKAAYGQHQQRKQQKTGEEVKRVANEDIREYAKKRNVKLWEIAALFGCNDGNFSRKLRIELNVSDKKRIMDIVDRIKRSRNNESR